MANRTLTSVTLVLALLVAGCHGTKHPSKGSKAMSNAGVAIQPWGHAPDGSPVEIYTLTNSSGMIVKVTNYGATITEIHVPDRSGNFADVALGFDSLDGYTGGKSPYFGCTAGRYANRIAKGKFAIDGKEYTLATNNGPNHLHGGKKGFDKVTWIPVSNTHKAGDTTVTLKYVSKDGEEGYPGNLTSTVAFTLTEENEIKIDYRATTDKATPINLTNHTYFNLAGAAQKDVPTVLDHELMLKCDKYTPVDDTQIPTGELKSVEGTPMDFRKSTAIGKRIAQVPGGYDHNYCINGGGKGKVVSAGRVLEPKSGRVVEFQTDQPGLQLYTGNFLNGTITNGKGGATYDMHDGFCLETQHYPDSPNQPAFPSTILKPGGEYKSTTVYRFSTK